jgi:hypothetical protein
MLFAQSPTSTSSPGVNFATSSRSGESDREKLEKSFEELHTKKSSITHEEFGSASKSKDSLSNDSVSSRRRALDDLSSKLINLGSRISNLRDNLVSSSATANANISPRDSASRVVENAPPSDTTAKAKIAEDGQNKPAANFRELLKQEKVAEEVAKTSDPSYVTRVQSSNLRRRLEIERMQGEIEDLDKALEHLKSGSLRFDLARQRKELVRLVEDLEKQMEPLYPYNNWNKGRDKPQLKPRSKSDDVFPMIFGQKSTAISNTASEPNRAAQELAAEVQKQKVAMKAAEEIKPERQDERLNDAELVEAIKKIYQEAYGEVDGRVQSEQPLLKGRTISNDASSKPAVQDTDPSLSVKETPSPSTSEDTPIAASPSPPSKSPTLSPTAPPENAVYTILAYDPSTSEVSTTTISAPISATDSTVPITVALTQLGEPAKFLPHLRLLANHGTAVNVTKNLLVLRSTSPSTNSAKSTPTIPEENLSSNEQDILGQKNENTKDSPRGDSAKGAGPRRIEPVFSGRARQDRWDHSEQQGPNAWVKFMKRLGIASGVGVAILYIGGVTAGLRRVTVPKESER